MIARVWTAKLAPSHARAYADHLRGQVLPALRAVAGYEGAQLLEREAADGVEVVVISYWRSLDSVRGFAGEDLERAVVSAAVAPFLLRYDQRVAHYEVVVRDETALG